jgi:RimJ/RimL family protein N-acetyltransferase
VGVDIQLAVVDPGTPGRPVGDVPFWDETRAALGADGGHRAWYVLHEGDLVGLIGASAIGERGAQVGYGVTPSREGRGVASAALRALLEELRREGVVTVLADTLEVDGVQREVVSYEVTLDPRS